MKLGLKVYLEDILDNFKNGSKSRSQDQSLEDIVCTQEATFSSLCL